MVRIENSPSLKYVPRGIKTRHVLVELEEYLPNKRHFGCLKILKPKHIFICVNAELKSRIEVSNVIKIMLIKTGDSGRRLYINYISSCGHDNRFQESNC